MINVTLIGAMPFEGLLTAASRPSTLSSVPFGCNTVRCTSFGPVRAGTKSTSNVRPLLCNVVLNGAFTAVRAGAAFTRSAVVARTTARNRMTGCSTLPSSMTLGRVLARQLAMAS